MSCKKCGSFNTEVKMHGINYAHVCSDCGAFIKWAKKGEEPANIDVVTPPCEYCEEPYVIPRNFDGGIVGWDNIEANYCPICGRALK